MAVQFRINEEIEKNRQNGNVEAIKIKENCQQTTAIPYLNLCQTMRYIATFIDVTMHINGIFLMVLIDIELPHNGFKVWLNFYD